jgi:hypothetical protein
LSLYGPEEGQPDVRWVSVGQRCTNCGTLGSFVDWKVGYVPHASFPTKPRRRRHERTQLSGRLSNVIDLIYIRRQAGSALAVALLGGDAADAKMLGPVPAVGWVSQLAPLLAAERPGEFPTVEDAEAHLFVVHFRNINRGSNSAGQSYPCEITD